MTEEKKWEDWKAKMPPLHGKSKNCTLSRILKKKIIIFEIKHEQLTQ
jgi:hypothetical protein